MYGVSIERRGRRFSFNNTTGGIYTVPTMNNNIPAMTSNGGNELAETILCL